MLPNAALIKFMIYYTMMFSNYNLKYFRETAEVLVSQMKKDSHLRRIFCQGVLWTPSGNNILV